MFFYFNLTAKRSRLDYGGLERIFIEKEGRKKCVLANPPLPNLVSHFLSIALIILHSVMS
jgi:hypothetical protein